MSLAFVFPGQGSQSIGMMSALARVSPLIEATFAEASAVLGYDLWRRCQEGPVEALNSTECTQPAMLTAGFATMRLWRERGGPPPVLMAGHSLGEFTALVAAGTLDFATAVELVRYRGELMQTAVPPGQGAMAAILGLEDADIEEACDEASQGGEVVEAVNFNAPGQVVIAGAAAAVARAVEIATAKGARRALALPISVHGVHAGCGRRGLRRGRPDAFHRAGHSCRARQTAVYARVLGRDGAHDDFRGCHPHHGMRARQGIDGVESAGRQESGSENDGAGGSAEPG
jgi:malonyl CoA-acyl carrier protein transacylase